jgi:RHS repeat-associated protein
LGISWTSYNHPLVINNSGSGESIQFAYNQNHERWSAIYNGGAGVETTYFIGDMLEKVVTVGSSDYRHYIYAGRTKVAVYSRTTAGTNTVRYLREDNQGSVAAILNSDGTSYAKESFTAFGARRSACTWSGPPTGGALAKMNSVSRRGYTWQTALGTMGLNDMNGRIQDAFTGRFLSPDPFVDEPANTQSWNRYSYVINNPLTYLDPSGFSKYNRTQIVNGGGGSADGLETVPVYGSRGDMQFEVPPSGSWDGVQNRNSGNHEQQGNGGSDRPTAPPESTPPLPEVPISANRPTLNLSWVTWNFINERYIGDRGAVDISPTSVCVNPARANNPNLNRNMAIGAGVVGTTVGAAVAGAIAANILGAPEVEIGEGAYALYYAANGAVRLWRYTGAVRSEMMMVNAVAQDAVTASATLGIMSAVAGAAAGGDIAMLLTPSSCQ